MAASGQPSSSEPKIADEKKAAKKAANDGKKELRILMLHGFTQSGPLFRAKTRALEKLLNKALAPVGFAPTLIYPTGPLRLSVRDVPGYTPASDGDGEEQEIDSWGWFRRDEATGAYRHLEAGMQRIAETMRDAVGSALPSSSPAAGDALPSAGWGGIDGVIGFSQGACTAALLAAAMEGGRASPAGVEEKNEWEWVRAVREANGGAPLRFAVVYSGFWPAPEELRWLSEPPMTTPTLHFIGSLDTVVEEKRSQDLAARCQDPVVIVHPGGHYVPISKDWVMPLVGFIRKCIG